MAFPAPEHRLLDPSPESDPENLRLSRSLYRLESFLRFFGFYQHKFVGLSLSYLVFIVVAVAAPAVVVSRFFCDGHSTCDKYHVKSYEIQNLICEVFAAGISLLCLSHNLRKYGLKKFLCLDRCEEQFEQFRGQFARKINESFCLLVISLLPCFILKAFQEIARVLYVHHDSLWQSVLSSSVLLVSWTYSTTLFLTGSILFNLVCNLQVILLENYGKLLERDLDVSVYIEEHISLLYHLSKISHRFRIFLILELLVVTVSQFMALMETTGTHERMNFVNGAGFVVCSVAMVIGMTICMRAAAKISHRAQQLGSVASRWHLLVTSNSNEGSHVNLLHNGNYDTATSVVPVMRNYSESDLESGDYVTPPTNLQLASHMSSYHKRQALVTYLQSNPGGVTVFGFIVDRALILTIFFIEYSVVTFVLGKTISFSTK